VDKYFESRVNKLRSSLEKQNTQDLIILKDENIFYLTGFYGKDSESILLLINNDLYLLVNFIHLEQARKSIYNSKIKIIQYFKGKYEKLSEILRNYNVKAVGIEGKNIAYSDFVKLEKILSLKGSKLVSLEDLVENLRAVKDDNEITKIKKACEITDNAYSNLLSLKSSDIFKFSEIELMHEIEKWLINSGSDGKSFDIIVASNENSSAPHHISSRKKIKSGTLLMDFGCRFKNYCSDITRTIFTDNNKNNNKIKKVYNIVLQSQLKAREACREGISCSELDAVARNFIKSKGYGKNFGHGLGHGVGIEVHEKPAVSYRSKAVLKKNMIITIEPGIYIENLGGVRIEDMVLVKKNCCEVLYKSTKGDFK